MTARGRRLTLVAVALAALIAAGSVGAVLRATVFKIQYHQFAYLAGTSNLYCTTFTQVWKPASFSAQSFNCYFLPQGAPHLTSGYQAIVNRNGVTVYRWAQGGSTRTRQFDNPGVIPAKNPGQITIPSSLGGHAAPGNP